MSRSHDEHLAAREPLAGGQNGATQPIGSSPRLARATQRDVEHASALPRAFLESVDEPREPSLAALRAGEASALEALARRELPRVERLLRRLLGYRSDLEDLVQTVFLEACRALPSFRGDSSLSTFVGGITVKVARRAMRPSAYTRRRGPMPEDPGTTESSTEAGAVARAQLARLDEALAKLTADKREAFVLWAIEGADVPVIAKATGASVSATRSRIYYAQKELKTFAARDPYLRELLGGDDA